MLSGLNFLTAACVDVVHARGRGVNKRTDMAYSDSHDKGKAECWCGRHGPREADGSHRQEGERLCRGELRRHLSSENFGAKRLQLLDVRARFQVDLGDVHPKNGGPER